MPSTGLYPRPPRSLHPSSSTPAAVATGETGDDHPAEGHDAADDGHDHGADGVDDAHEAGSDGVEDACDLFLLVYCKWSVYGMYMECMLGGMGIRWCRHTQDTTAPILGFVCTSYSGVYREKMCFGFDCRNAIEDG